MIEVTQASFKEHTQTGLVLLDFFADWCGPCRTLTPILEKLENISVVKVNVDDCQELSVDYNVNVIPCLIFLKDGKEIERSLGLQSQENLQQTIDQLNASGD